MTSDDNDFEVFTCMYPRDDEDGLTCGVEFPNSEEGAQALIEHLAEVHGVEI